MEASQARVSFKMLKSQRCKALTSENDPCWMHALEMFGLDWNIFINMLCQLLMGFKIILNQKFVYVNKHRLLKRQLVEITDVICFLSEMMLIFFEVLNATVLLYLLKYMTLPGSLWVFKVLAQYLVAVFGRYLTLTTVKLLSGSQREASYSVQAGKSE